MSGKELSQKTLDALAQASAAVTEPAMLSQIQASLDGIDGLDVLDIKSVEPAIAFTATYKTPGEQS